MTVSDVLVQDYLARLERAAAAMDVDRRDELLAGIQEHIEAARAAGVAEDEAGVRTLLDRLGEPQEIVAAAADSDRSGPHAATGDGAGWEPPAAAEDGVGSGRGDPTTGRRRRRGTGLELASVLLLTAGSFFPALGWLSGVVLLWCSDRWRVREKLLGTLIVPLGPGGVLVFGALLPFRAYTESCSATPTPLDDARPLTGPAETVMTCTSTGPPPWLGAVLLVLLLLASVAVPVWLYRTARRRADERG